MPWRIEDPMSELLSEEPVLCFSDRTQCLYLELPLDILQQDVRGGRPVRLWIGDTLPERSRLYLCIEDEGIIHMDLRVRVERIADPTVDDVNVILSVLRTLQASARTRALLLLQLRRFLPQGAETDCDDDSPARREGA